MRVLIIEQEKTLQQSLSLFMARHKNFDVFLAHTLEEGKSLLETICFDMVLCRDRLPDGDGLEILKEMGQKNPKLISILMTAHGDERLKDRVRQAGICGYLEKPFELKSSSPRKRESTFCSRVWGMALFRTKLLRTIFLCPLFGE